MTKLNKITAKMIAADFFLQSGWGLISPIFAIFITEQIKGNIEIVAFVTATYWIIKSAIQPALAICLDTVKGEKDDFNFLILGMTIAAFVPLGYFFASKVYHIFILESIRGVAMSFVTPAWHGIFTRHLKKGWEAFSWSVKSTGLGFASGLAAAFGGILATFMGFKVVFILVFLLKTISVSIFIIIRKKLFPKTLKTT